MISKLCVLIHKVNFNDTNFIENRNKEYHSSEKVFINVTLKISPFLV